MINSIQHFQQDGVKRLIKIFEEYGKDITKMAEMVYGVTKEVTNLGCSMIAEEWESYDEILRKEKICEKDGILSVRMKQLLQQVLEMLLITGLCLRIQRQVIVVIFLINYWK